MKINELINEQKVSSSWLKDVTLVNGVAIMTLQSGMQYQISDFPEAEFETWMNSPSIGAHFTKNVKPNYTVQKM